jgi:hypothetical protein
MAIAQRLRGARPDTVPTEPIGGIPRSYALRAAMRARQAAWSPTRGPIRQAERPPSALILACPDQPLPALPRERSIEDRIDPLVPPAQPPGLVRYPGLAAARDVRGMQPGSDDDWGGAHDCGFAALCGDLSASQETALAGIRARAPSANGAADAQRAHAAGSVVP